MDNDIKKSPCEECEHRQGNICLVKCPYGLDEEREQLWDDILDKVLIIDMVLYCDKHKIKSLSALADYAKENNTEWYKLLCKLGYKDKNE